MRSLALILLALAAAQQGGRPGNAAAPRLDDWKIIGPGGGGSMYFPTIAQNGKDVLARCDMTGAYISHDAGATWRIFNLRGTVSFFVFDPRDPKVIYAATAPLWRSTDGGESWRLLYPDPASIDRIEMIDDHAAARHITKDGRSPRVTALAVDPGDSKTLYAAISDGGATALYISQDWGGTWKKSADLPGGGGAIWIDPKSPRRDRTLYVAGRNSIAVRRRTVWTQGPAPEGVLGFSGV
jgi:hypothetical protein